MLNLDRSNGGQAAMMQRKKNSLNILPVGTVQVSADFNEYFETNKFQSTDKDQKKVNQRKLSLFVGESILKPITKLSNITEEQGENANSNMSGVEGNNDKK